MNPTIDKMLTVTAEIAEMLLSAKDNDLTGISTEAKLRIIELAEMAAEIPEVQPQEEAATAVESAVEPENVEQTVIEEHAAHEEPAVEATPQEEFELEIDEAHSADEEPVTEEESTPIAATEPVIAPETEVGLEPEPEPMAEIEVEAEPMVEIHSDTETDPATATETDPQTPAMIELEPESEQMPVDLSLWRGIFSVNDMFLFRRELFNGSESLMTDALGRLGHAGSLDQVRAILADRYGIDLRSRAAKDFINTIATLF